MPNPVLPRAQKNSKSFFFHLKEIIIRKMEELVIYGAQAAAGASGPRTKKVSSGTSTGTGVITVYDLHSGSPYQNFKNVTLPRGSSLQALDASDGKRLYSTQHNSSVMLTYHWSRESCVQTIVLPEKLSALKVSPSGTWIVGGAQSGRIYMWEVRSGNLVTVREKHYQEITAIKFTADETFVFTGSKDSTVLGWRLMDLITSSLEGGVNFGDQSISNDSNSVQPVFSWTKIHSLEITGLCVGYGQGLDNRVYTSSLDNTVRCWDLAQNDLVSTYVLPEKISAMAIDPAERSIYAGLVNGDILLIPRYKVNSSTGVVEGPRGNNEKITLNYEDNSDIILSRPDSDIKSSVTCLDISFDGTILAAGYSDGQVYTWDITTKQVLRKLPSHKEAISSIQILSRLKSDSAPKQSVASSSGALSSASEKADQVYKVPFFKRILNDQELKTTHEVWMQLPGQSQTTSKNRAGPSEIEKVRLKAGNFSDHNSDTTLQARVQELEGVLAKAQKSYTDLSRMHKELWHIHTEES